MTSLRKTVGVMWGTSNGRAFVLGDALRREVRLPGVAKVQERAFVSSLQVALGELGVPSGEPLQIIMAGMIGSSIGWADAGYRPCPFDLSDVFSLVPVEAPLGECLIVPGVSCSNPLGDADVMRGEETELIGWLASHPEAQQGRWLVCLPGTHVKWALVEDGRLKSFLTGMTGELFALLSEHSVLLGPAAQRAGFDEGTFLEGVADGARRGVSVLHQLFSVRARSLVGRPASHPAERLSGLIIGADCAAAMRVFEFSLDRNPVVVIGAEDVARRYGLALDALGIEASFFDSGEAARQGIASISGGIAS